MFASKTTTNFKNHETTTTDLQIRPLSLNELETVSGGLKVSLGHISITLPVSLGHIS